MLSPALLNKAKTINTLEMYMDFQVFLVKFMKHYTLIYTHEHCCRPEGNLIETTMMFSPKEQGHRTSIYILSFNKDFEEGRRLKIYFSQILSFNQYHSTLRNLINIFMNYEIYEVNDFSVVWDFDRFGNFCGDDVGCCNVFRDDVTPLVHYILKFFKISNVTNIGLEAIVKEFVNVYIDQGSKIFSSYDFRKYLDMIKEQNLLAFAILFVEKPLLPKPIIFQIYQNTFKDGTVFRLPLNAKNVV